ncbi:MAG: hypothetical protein ACYDCY_11365, partial [Metallibacterium sp.]
AKPGILPPDSERLRACKRSRRNRATFVATSAGALIATALWHPRILLHCPSPACTIQGSGPPRPGAEWFCKSLG